MAKVRGYITDLTTNEGLTFALNPQQFEERYEAGWTERAHLAGSYRRLQFNSTANPRIAIELVFNRALLAIESRVFNTYDETDLRRRIERAKNFLESLCYPRQHQGSVLAQSPPPVLVVWPEVMAIRCVTMSCGIRNDEFDERGELVQFTATMEFQEQRVYPIYSDRVRKVGSMRGSKSARVYLD